jgi:hypothetical protein
MMQLPSAWALDDHTWRPRAGHPSFQTLEPAKVIGINASQLINEQYVLMKAQNR